MDRNNVEWLNHLEEAVPREGYGNRLSMYLIALEAWRRGIQINFFTIDNPENKLLIRYSLEYNGKEYRFESSLGDKLSPEAYDVCEYKDLTKQYLSDAGIKVPKGKVFATSAKKSEIIEFANSLSFPVVVKPLNENAGKGVFSNVDSEESLIDVLNYLGAELSYRNVIVEEYIPGTEYRVLTVDGKVEGVVNRVPANIIGNGKDTISALIKKKNRSKHINPAISKKHIKLDKEVLQTIKNRGYTQESILEEGEQLFLRSKSNISAGGDPWDITDEVSDEIKETAEKATKAIPGLNIAGLDFIVDPETGKPTVIEINTKPMIGLHVFPVAGKSRDVVKSIVDLYFPETKGLNRSNLYFDFAAKIGPLDNLTVKKVQVMPLEKITPYITRKLHIMLENPEKTLMKEVRLEALKLGIHGHVAKLNQKEYMVIVASESEESIQTLKSLFNDESDRFSIAEIKEEAWEKPVNAGFVISKNTEVLSERLREEEKKNKSLSTELEALETKLENERNENRRLQEWIEHYTSEMSKVEDELVRIKNKNIEATLKLGEAERAFISTEYLLKEEKEQLQKKYNELWSKYKGVVNSKSWRVTKPLRRYNPKR